MKILFAITIILDFCFYGLAGFLLSGLAVNMDQSIAVGILSGIVGTAADLYLNRGKIRTFSHLLNNKD